MAVRPSIVCLPLHGLPVTFLRQPMSPEPVTGSWIDIPVPAGPDAAPTVLSCWWARPAGEVARAGVLVLPEVFGVNPWVRSVADRLAEQGYGALAVPLFARTAPGLELGYDDASLAEGRSHKERTTTPQLLADLGAAADWLSRELALTPPAVLGCVGFCFGGHAALLASTLPSVGATCDFYGAGVATGRPGGGPPSLELLGQVAGRLWCFCGDDDPLIPAAEVASIAAALGNADPSGARHRLMRAAAAGHGYMCSEREVFNEAAAAEGWRSMLELFGGELPRWNN